MIAAGRKLTREEQNEEYKAIVQRIPPLADTAGVSIEVFADFDTSAEQMLAQGEQMFTWIPNAYIKYPCIGVGAPGNKVEKGQFFILESISQPGFQKKWTHDLLVHRAVKELTTGFAPVFRTIHSDIGILKHRLADVCGDVSAMPIDVLLKISSPSSRNACVNEDWILSATRRASLGSAMSSARIVNSSPPILPSLRHARRLLLTSPPHPISLGDFDRNPGAFKLHLNDRRENRVILPLH